MSQHDLVNVIAAGDAAINGPIADIQSLCFFRYRVWAAPPAVHSV
jgi:hypothetical protein